MSGRELFERNRARLLDLLKRLSYEEREVILSSGQKSNFYIDCKQAVLSAEGHFLVGWLFNRVIAENAPEVEAVGGLTMAPRSGWRDVSCSAPGCRSLSLRTL